MGLEVYIVFNRSRGAYICAARCMHLAPYMTFLPLTYGFAELLDNPDTQHEVEGRKRFWHCSCPLR